MATTNGSTISLGAGIDMPIVGLGTFNNLRKDGREVYEAVKAAIDVGYRLIDCAWVYQSEEEIGDAIAEKIKEGKVTRKDLFVTTKLWNFFHHPDRVENGLDESLKALKMDYVDLLLMHWPMAWEEPADRSVWIMSKDVKPADVDFVDTWRAMERLLDTGKVKAIGVSNFNKGQLTRLLEAPGLKVKPVNMQVEIHPYMANSELLQLCLQHGITVTAYSPLAKGGAAYAGGTAPNVLEEEALKAIAAKHSKTPAQVALRWGIQRGYAIVPKSVTPARIKENLEVLDFTLEKEEMQAISALDKNQRVVTLALFKDYPEYPF